MQSCNLLFNPGDVYVHFARPIVLGYHSIPKINWGSFRGRYHFGVDLAIIAGSGSFRGPYTSLLFASLGSTGFEDILGNGNYLWDLPFFLH